MASSLLSIRAGEAPVPMLLELPILFSSSHDAGGDDARDDDRNDDQDVRDDDADDDDRDDAQGWGMHYPPLGE